MVTATPDPTPYLSSPIPDLIEAAELVHLIGDFLAVQVLRVRFGSEFLTETA